MRLVCPKCTVQYEVGDDAIPLDGRDVQCSACGNSWFQRHPTVPPQQTLVAALTLPAGAQDTEATSAPPPRRPLDEKVMAILREEALREAAARRTEPDRVNAPPPPPPAEPEHSAPQITLIQPAPKLPIQSGGPRPAPRRELLPDIEEINSTLAAGSRRRATVTLPPEDPRPGFRAGFGLMMGLVALAAGAYVLASRISVAIPETSEVMTAYVGQVDHLRRQLDVMVVDAQQRVETLLLSAE